MTRVNRRWKAYLARNKDEQEGNSRKVPRLRHELEAENQQEKSMEAEGLCLERSK